MLKFNRFWWRRVFLALLFLGLFAGYFFSHPEHSQPLPAPSFFSGSPNLVSSEREASLPVSSKALDVLNSLAVKAPFRAEKYYRKLFYKDWQILASGCNTREAILARDLKNLRFVARCKVASGELEDPYTAKLIKFTRGQKSSALVQIDHVVALGNAWSTGAAFLSPAQRLALSQDPLNLLAVDGKANQAKSDGDAATWLPENRAFRCAYVARQISVKYKYHLWVTPAEEGAMKKVLSSCPDQSTIGAISLRP